MISNDNNDPYADEAAADAAQDLELLHYREQMAFNERRNVKTDKYWERKAKELVTSPENLQAAIVGAKAVATQQYADQLSQRIENWLDEQPESHLWPQITVDRSLFAHDYEFEFTVKISFPERSFSDWVAKND